jgi:hypothetical protein
MPLLGIKGMFDKKAFELEFYQLTDTKGEIQDRYNQII